MIRKPPQLDDDYAKFIVINCDDQDIRALIENALNNFMATPEGRAVIQEAFEKSNKDNWIKGARVSIKYDENASYGGQAIQKSGEIMIGGLLKAQQYAIEGGEYAQFSIERTLFHELCHIAYDPKGLDPMKSNPEKLELDAYRIYTDNPDMEYEDIQSFRDSLLDLRAVIDGRNTYEEALQGYISQLREIYKIQANLHGMAPNDTERGAVLKTNNYMAKYFGEIAREKYTPNILDSIEQTRNEVDLGGTPELESHNICLTLEP